MIRGKPIFVGAGKLDTVHGARAKDAADLYRYWGADVTFEEWPGAMHWMVQIPREIWLSKTKLRKWLITYGPLKYVGSKLAEARAAEESGRLGEAFSLYHQVSPILPTNELCVEAAQAAFQLAQQAEKQLAFARQAQTEKRYAEAIRRLEEIAAAYAGSTFADIATEQKNVWLNTQEE